MGENGVLVFPDAAKGAASSIDPNLLLALQNNGGMNGGMGYWWILFLWMMWNQNGRNGNFSDFVAQSGNEGRQYLAEIMNGRFDNLGNLANILNTSVESIKNNLFAIQSNIQNVASQIGMSGLQVQNAIQAGNAALSQQLCNCCCENRVAILNQTNALQSQLASNHAATQLQMAQIESADQLAVCKQTNELATQADRNSTAILNAINAQTVAMNDQFCQLKERELQSKIDTQGDIITQLRGQISNDKQTEAFNAAFNSLNEKINILSAKSPNTVPVVYPNLTAINNTPCNGGFNPWGYGFGGQSYWG
jgi:hypothetical protein